MDTKTPPIPLKLPQEKPQPKRAERVADVWSLPPLTVNPQPQPQPQAKSNIKNKSLGTSYWPQQDEPPCHLTQHRDRRKDRCRPYRYKRVLHLGATPLMHACQQGNRPRVLRLLKEQEATIGYRDRTLRNALHYCMDAATGGAVAAAAPELVNAPDAEGHTPLHLAVIAGDSQLVAVLLANGADVNAKDLEGHSVLHWATVCGEAECVRLVLAAGARPSTGDLRGGSPLHYAAQCCGAAATAELAVPRKVGLKVLQTLLEFGADVNAKDEDGRQPILWAASAGSVEAVLALARAGGTAAAGTSDKDGLTALHCAASRGHARCVEALVNLCGSQPDHGQLETLKILAQHGGSLHVRTVRGTGVGHEAVASGRIELVKWLAKKRPSMLDVATQDGKTPLHVAALHGHLDVCKLLLDRGARINAVLRTSKGSSMTPLDAALYRGHRDCAKLIQMHGGTTAQQLGVRKVARPNREVIVVKKSLEKTCEKVVSERRSKTPGESTKETKLTKMHKRSSKRMSRSSKQTKMSDNERNTTKRDESPNKEEKNVEELLGHIHRRTSDKSAKEDEDKYDGIESRIMESRYGIDGTDSTSQETVERVTVTAMIHKDSQIPDTPKSMLETFPLSKTDIGSSGPSFPKKDPSQESSCEDKSGKVDVTVFTKLESSLKAKEVDDKREEGKNSRTEHMDARCSDAFEESMQGEKQEITTRENEPAPDKSSNLSIDVVESESARNLIAEDREKVEGKLVFTEEEKDSPPEHPTCITTVEQAVEYSTSLGDENGRSITAENVQPDKEVISSKHSEDAGETQDIHEVKVIPEQTKQAESFDLIENPDPVGSGSADSNDTVTLRTVREDKKKRAESFALIDQPPLTNDGTKDFDTSLSLSKSDEASSSPERLAPRSRKKSDDERATVEIGGKDSHHDIDDNYSPRPSKPTKSRRSRPSTGRSARTRESCSSKSPTKTKKHSFESSEEHSPDRSAIIAVIDSPAWDEDEAAEKEENREIPGKDLEQEDNESGVAQILPGTSEKEPARALAPSTGLTVSRPSGLDSLPRVPSATSNRLVRIENSDEGDRERPWRKQRRDSGGRDSGIEPSPRVSRIPRRRNARCCPNTAKQQALHMETITRDVQISLRRYHLERKIFFQLMELKRLQIRHGRANEHVLVKRQVDAFHKSGMTGPTLGVVKYDRPLTFRQFEGFLYEQLRRLQGKPTTPDFCTEARQCTQKTHRCHHATSAYTSVPVYTYLAGGVPDRTDHLPKIESRGRGHMTVEVTHGEEKQVIALPTERLDRTKRYFVTFTVKGETRDIEKLGSVCTQRRNAKSV
ncbi:Ankyrin repeat, PH and SEC7 domain containing protein secG [Harpegnathos saltator]|uniref:Ankyrin repeat, PH and SEC7 domain containing protein secG n=1 Tax=Harpegnathos saltator TaxID=610380 RepID=E2BPF5_HARSA|nr:Ankyrin repeat, PH and SEC7 domain containing protein secG [Harpegnathos saltator]